MNALSENVARLEDILEIITQKLGAEFRELTTLFTLALGLGMPTEFFKLKPSLIKLKGEASCPKRISSISYWF